MSLSHYILDELRRVLPKLRSRHGLSDDGIADLIDCLAFQADLVEPAAHWDAQLTDPLDRKSTRLNSSHRNTARMPSSA